jgi:large subunit ribosomal protein L38
VYIPLDEVKKEWYTESWSTHVLSMAEHYGIYQDLFGHAFFNPRIQLDVSYDYDDELVTPVHRGNQILPSEVSGVVIVSLVI